MYSHVVGQKVDDRGRKEECSCKRPVVSGKTGKGSL